MGAVGFIFFQYSPVESQSFVLEELLDENHFSIIVSMLFSE